MRIWRPWLLHNPGQTHSFFSLTGPGSWSYRIKADVLQNTALGNRYLHFLILSALQQVNTNKGPYKSPASDDSPEAARQSIVWCRTCVPSFFFLSERNVAWQTWALLVLSCGRSGLHLQSKRNRWRHISFSSRYVSILLCIVSCKVWNNRGKKRNVVDIT